MGAEVGELFVVEPGEDFLLGDVGRAREELLESGGDECVALAGVGAVELFGEDAGGFDELRAVEKHEGLEGGVRGVAAGDADHALGDVEGFEHGRGAGASPERVHTATIECFACAGGRGFEGFRDVVGVNGRAADFFHEEAAGGEGLVADHFGGEAVTRTAGEPDIFRIVGHDLGSGEAALAVGLREDDGFMQGFYVPAGADEFAGEPVEEFGIFGAVTLAAEVVGGLDEAATEEGLPEAIHRHAREQRMARVGEPAGEAEAVARLIGRKGGEGGGGVGANGGAALIVFTALEDVGRLGLREFAHDHDFLGLIGEFGLRRAGGGERGELGAVGLVVMGEVGVEVGWRRKRRLRGSGIDAADLEGGEFAGEDPELVNEAALEAAVAETFAEGDGVAATAGDVFGEVIANDLGAGGLAVDEEVEAGGAAGAIVGDGEVDPFIDREGIGGADRNRVAGPEMDERPFRAAVFDEELVAAAAGVGPRARAVQDDGALFDIGGLNPE